MSDVFAALAIPLIDRPGVAHESEDPGEAVRHRVRRDGIDNPWGLTNTQASAMSLLAKTGCNKLIAREIGVSHHSVEQYLRDAREKMCAPNRVIAALMWDRHTRGSQ